MRAIFFISIMVSFFALEGKGQEIDQEKKYNIKLSFVPDSRDVKFSKNHQIRGEFNYLINKHFDLGLYVAYSRYMQFKDISPTEFEIMDRWAPLYGLNANLHILSFFKEMDNFPVDLYVAGKAGGYYCKANELEFYNGNYWQYFTGGGIAWYPINNMGTYLEYGYENTGLNNDVGHDLILFGLTFKF
jgi:hypothetical protein